MDIGLVDFPLKSDIKFIFTLENDMNTLFGSNPTTAAILKF